MRQVTAIMRVEVASVCTGAMLLAAAGLTAVSTEIEHRRVQEAHRSLREDK